MMPSKRSWAQIGFVAIMVAVAVYATLWGLYNIVWAPKPVVGGALDGTPGGGSAGSEHVRTAMGDAKTTDLYELAKRKADAQAQKHFDHITGRAQDLDKHCTTHLCQIARASKEAEEDRARLTQEALASFDKSTAAVHTQGKDDASP